MYSLRLRCSSAEVELVSAELWDFDANAIYQSEADGEIVLLAGFDSLDLRELLLKRFSPFHPEWESDDTDWVEVTRAAWPPREIGRTLFLAPPWRQDPTPSGRHRVIHIP